MVNESGIDVIVPVPETSAISTSGRAAAITNTRPRLLIRPLVAVRTFFTVKKTSSASARDFLARERNFFVWLRLSTLLAVLSASLLLQLKLPDSPHEQPRKRRRDELPPHHLSLSSKVFAGIFFALSLLALGTGLADYLIAERQLELEKVDFDETAGDFRNDGHTTHFVHTVMILIGIGIIASALWLIIS